jgi:hypothetical protein
LTAEARTVSSRHSRSWLSSPAIRCSPRRSKVL